MQLHVNTARIASAFEECNDYHESQVKISLLLPAPLFKPYEYATAAKATRLLSLAGAYAEGEYATGSNSHFP